MSCVLIQEHKYADRILKKLFHWLKGKKIKIKDGVFHACKERPEHIKKMLQLAREKNINIMNAIIDKKKSKEVLSVDKHRLYTTMLMQLLDRSIEKGCLSLHEKIVLVVSRRETNKALNHSFVKELQSKYVDSFAVECVIKTPHEEKGLQIADTVAYAVYQKYQNNKNTYYQMIDCCICEEFLHIR